MVEIGTEGDTAQVTRIAHDACISLPHTADVAEHGKTLRTGVN